VEILKWLHETVHRKRPELWPSVWIIHYDNAPAHKAFSVKQFVTQKSINEVEHLPSSPDLAPYDFWLLRKISSALKGRRFQDIEDTQKKKRDDITESSSTTGIPEMFPAMETLLGQVQSCSRGVLRR
jgi:hypothetical protein